MAITQRRTLVRRAFVSVSAAAIAATVLAAGSSTASAAPTSGSPAASLTSLPDQINTPAALAAGKKAALAGYPVSPKLAASCGATH
jgi:hypothetical protein